MALKAVEGKAVDVQRVIGGIWIQGLGQVEGSNA